jgi:hypothetical protein
MMRKILTALSASVAISLAGCVTLNTAGPGGDAAMLDEVRAGTLELDCGAACSPLFIYQQTKLQQLYREQNWAELALTTAKTSYRRDITYFYLGVAAEGMQAWAAADRYYRMVGALASGKDTTAKCSAVRAMCGDFKFPRDIVERLQLVSSKLGREALSPRELAGVSTALQRPGVGDYIPEAPQALLEQYAARRLLAGSTGARRDQAFGDQLLEVLEPVHAHVERGVTSIWQGSVKRLNDRLLNQPEETRLALGMWVELREYDRASQTIALRYPLHAPNHTPNLGSEIYRGESPRDAPYRDFSLRGSTCVWENRSRGAQPGYLAHDTPQAYFLVLTLCQQRPSEPWRNAAITAHNAELPPLVQLSLPEGGLWPRARVSQARVDGLLRGVGSQRLVWAELVFDLRAVGSLDRGPFLASDTLPRMRTGMVAAIMPRALLLWERPPQPQQPGQLVGFAGDISSDAEAPRGRLPRALVQDRDYSALPLPVIAKRAPPQPVLPASAGRAGPSAAEQPRVAVPAALQPAPLPGPGGAGNARSAPEATPAARRTPAPTRPPAAPRQARAAADGDEEDWVEPPPARR